MKEKKDQSTNPAKKRFPRLRKIKIDWREIPRTVLACVAIGLFGKSAI